MTPAFTILSEFPLAQLSIHLTTMVDQGEEGNFAKHAFPDRVGPEFIRLFVTVTIPGHEYSNISHHDNADELLEGILAVMREDALLPPVHG